MISEKFVDAVRVLLIQLAQTDDYPAAERNRRIERTRQYLEGYLGIDRERLQDMTPASVDDVLQVCGFAVPPTPADKEQQRSQNETD